MDGQSGSIGGTGEKIASTNAGTNSINVSIDPHVLDCSICYTPLRPPIFQCPNGHVACSSCCEELQNKCHICSLPTGDRRCRALEAVIEALKIPCSHSTFGCPETIPYNKKYSHELFCPFFPCPCPVSSCTFRGPTARLSGHIRSEHHPTTPQAFFFYDRPFQVELQQEEPFYVLHEKDDDSIFLLLNAGNVPHGRSLSIVCINPGMELGLRYDIMVKGTRSELRLRARSENIRELEEAFPLKSFLFVPHEIIDSDGGMISVGVHIWK